MDIQNDQSPPVHREAARAVLLTPRHEVLLLRIQPPDASAGFWITPGGGLQPGETIEAGLRRELREELGLERFSMGPLVWRRRHTFNWDGRRICQNEWYHVVHADRFDPVMTDLAEAAILDRFHWWSLAELSHARERLTPLSLARIVRCYLADGPPCGPLEVEVLTD